MTREFKEGPPFSEDMETVEGGGLRFMTVDILLKAAVWRCSELDSLRKFWHREAMRERERADRLVQIARKAEKEPAHD